MAFYDQSSKERDVFKCILKNPVQQTLSKKQTGEQIVCSPVCFLYVLFSILVFFLAYIRSVMVSNVGFNRTSH